MHPYKLIKDLRTNHESSNINDILEVFAKSCNHSDSDNLIQEVLIEDNKNEESNNIDDILKDLYRTSSYLNHSFYQHSKPEKILFYF